MLLCLLVSRHHSECWGIGSKQSLSSSRKHFKKDDKQTVISMEAGQNALTAPHQFSTEHLIWQIYNQYLSHKAQAPNSAYLAGSFSSLSWWGGGAQTRHHIDTTMGKRQTCPGKVSGRGYLTRNLINVQRWLPGAGELQKFTAPLFYYEVFPFSPFYELDTRHSWMAPIFLKHSSHVFKEHRFSSLHFYHGGHSLSNSSSLSRVSHLGHMIHLTEDYLTLRYVCDSPELWIYVQMIRMCQLYLPGYLNPRFSHLYCYCQSPSLLSSLGWLTWLFLSPSQS